MGATGRMRKTMAAGAALLAAGAVLAGAGSRAEATPSTLGFYPSTDIYGKGIFHLDVDTYGQALRTDFPSVGLTYGIGPERGGFLGRSEAGFDYFLFQTGGDSAKRLFGNFKTQLYNDAKSQTRVVAGAWGLGSKDISLPNVAYVLASKNFDFGRIHVGVARSMTSANVVGNDRTNLQLGYDRYFANNKFQFAVDYYTGKTTYSGVQPTIYYYINNRANFGLGLFRANSSTLVNPRNQVYVCFDYNFGGGSDDVPDAPAPETTAPATGAPASN